jgi:t-SNARE complex subunit (syntaxin)
MRKLKEDKMKAPRPVVVTYDEEQEKKRQMDEKKKKFQKQHKDALEEEQEEKKVQTKWYMGEYAHNDGKLFVYVCICMSRELGVNIRS